MSFLKMKRDGFMEKKTLVIVLLIVCVLVLGEAIFLFAISRSGSSPEQIMVEATEAPTPESTEAPTPEPTPEEQAVVNSADDAEEEPTSTPKEEGNGFMVAIDAGHQSHGNSDTEPIGPGSSTKKAKVSDGATGCSTGVPEYKLNLDVAKKLQRELKRRGYKVYMIRKKNDVNISNVERAQAANDSGADICIRLHADGVDDSSARGASALYHTPDNPYHPELSKKSKKLSQCVLDAYCSLTGFNNRGLSKRDDLTGTNWSEIPVTLLEMGFMSNASEDETMQDVDFQYTMAEGIADGIDAYFGI